MEDVKREALRALENAKLNYTYHELSVRLNVNESTIWSWLKKQRINRVYAEMVVALLKE